ncbi:Na+/H+ antiporter NhaA [Bifidobacterium xylocopae]|nr:Na+/H+ antiporter NhaA [Bifidobacterium xylocopae]
MSLQMGVTVPRPGRRFHNFTYHLHTFAEDDRKAGLLMMSAALAGLVCANVPKLGQLYQVAVSWVPLSDLPTSRHLDLSVGGWVQDGLLACFFLVTGLELRQEMTSGTLQRPKQALLPLLSATGGVAVPIAVYVLINLKSPITAGGWAVPTATDVAFSLAALQILAPRTSPSVQAFLMTLAVCDDIIGVILIAVCFSEPGNVWGLLLAASGLTLWSVLARLRRLAWPAKFGMALAAPLAWYGFLLAGIHPVLAGVALGLLTPARADTPQSSSRAARLEARLIPLSALLALPLFAFCSLGIPLGGFKLNWLTSPVFLGICLGLALGKPVGIMGVVAFCSRLGIKPPLGARLPDLIAPAQLCGIGFTMSFLMAQLAFKEPDLEHTALVGVLAGSLLSVLLGTCTIVCQKRSSPRRPLDQNLHRPSKGYDR